MRSQILIYFRKAFAFCKKPLNITCHRITYVLSGMSLWSTIMKVDVLVFWYKQVLTGNKINIKFASPNKRIV